MSVGKRRKKNLDEGAFHHRVLAHAGFAEHDAHYTRQIVGGGAFAQKSGVLMHFFHVGHVGEEKALGIVQTFNALGFFGTDGDLGKLIAVKILNGGSACRAIMFVPPNIFISISGLSFIFIFSLSILFNYFNDKSISTQ